MAYLAVGVLVALLGIIAVFLVMRRKSVDKRSMYSARRSAIEHKVLAARQRTLAGHGHVEQAPEPVAAAPSPFAPTQAQPTIRYEPDLYQPPPVAPPPPPKPAPAPPVEMPAWETPAQQVPWQTGPAEPAPFEVPQAPVEPFRPAPEPEPNAQPSEPAWTPAPRPAEPATPIQQPVAASATGATAWSVVSTTKDSAVTVAPDHKHKDKKDRSDPTGDWQLASGEAPDLEGEEAEAKRPSGTVVAVAYYAVVVVGLLMVLIGVLIIIANSHVT
jgi:hypothetical protein